MAFRRASSSSDDSSGIKEELSEFSKEAGTYLKTRAELLAIESQEAGRIIGKRAGVLIAGILALVITYLTGLAAVIYLLGRWLDHLGDSILSNWAGASLLMAGAHLALAFICLKKQKQIGKKVPLFEYTRAEWQKDQQWIQNDEKQN